MSRYYYRGRGIFNTISSQCDLNNFMSTRGCSIRGDNHHFSARWLIRTAGEYIHLLSLFECALQDWHNIVTYVVLISCFNLLSSSGILTLLSSLIVITTTFFWHSYFSIVIRRNHQYLVLAFLLWHRHWSSSLVPSSGILTLASSLIVITSTFFWHSCFVIVIDRQFFWHSCFSIVIDLHH